MASPSKRLGYTRRSRWRRVLLLGVSLWHADATEVAVSSDYGHGRFLEQAEAIGAALQQRMGLSDAGLRTLVAERSSVLSVSYTSDVVPSLDLLQHSLGLTQSELKHLVLEVREFDTHPVFPTCHTPVPLYVRN